MEVVLHTSEFDFKSLHLSDPQPLAGQSGFYSTQLGFGTENKTICLQLPPCVTKQGVINVKNGKYMDLMFERAHHDILMQWVEKLEYACQDIIDTKKELWFQTELSRDDIETMMTQITRLYQSGTYVLMRVFIDTVKSAHKCIAYDENEIGVDLDTIEANKTIIPLVMIEGVNFSSKSFEISLKLIQVMVIDKNEKTKSSCLIKRLENSENTVSTSINSLPLEKTIKNSNKSSETIKPSPITSAPITSAIAPITSAPITSAPITSAPITSAPITSAIAPIRSAPITSSPINAISKSPVVTIKNDNIKQKQNINITNDIFQETNPINLEKINKNNSLHEITIDYANTEDAISLKKPNEVYQELYKKAIQKAKNYRLKSIESYLEAKKIKTKFLFDDMNVSDESDESELSNNENN